MTSTRLPGKVLLDVAGRPMLAQQLRRLAACTAVDEVVIATTSNVTDDPVVDLARREGVGWFRGSEEDVLARFVGAARQAKADVVVRVTADCPLIDPGVADAVIEELTDHAAECDYASNVLERTYPRGLDAEALFADVLVRIDRLAHTAADREHVTLLPRSTRPDLFLCRSVRDVEDNADLRWTVDTEADLRLVRELYERLELGARVVPYREVLAHVRAHPELGELNARVETWSPP